MCTRHCLYAAHSAWSQQCVYVQRCAHNSGVCSTYMCSAAVLLCVCVCRMRVRVRACHTTSPSSSVPAVQIPSITCVHLVSAAVCTQLSLSVCSTYMTCVAQQYSCVFACVGCAYVFEPAILPHLPPAFLRYKSLPSPVYTWSVQRCAHSSRCLCVVHTWHV